MTYEYNSLDLSVFNNTYVCVYVYVDVCVSVCILLLIYYLKLVSSYISSTPNLENTLQLYIAHIPSDNPIYINPFY